MSRRLGGAIAVVIGVGLICAGALGTELTTRRDRLAACLADAPGAPTVGACQGIAPEDARLGTRWWWRLPDDPSRSALQDQFALLEDLTDAPGVGPDPRGVDEAVAAVSRPPPAAPDGAGPWAELDRWLARHWGQAIDRFLDGLPIPSGELDPRLRRGIETGLGLLILGVAGYIIARELLRIRWREARSPWRRRRPATPEAAPSADRAPTGSSSRSRAARVLAGVLTTLQEHGWLEPEPGATPRELATRLTTRDPPCGRALATVVAGVEPALYGGAAFEAADEARVLEAARPALEAGERR